MIPSAMFSFEWVRTSRGAVRVGRVVCAITAVGLLTSVGLAVFALVAQRELSGADWLLIPGIPALAAGQLWGIAVIGARRPERFRRSTFGVAVRDPRANSAADARRFFFDGLPKYQANALLGIVALVAVNSFTAFPGLSRGGEASGTPGCPYRLNNHGVYTCVSRSTYNHAGAATQRFACGIVAGFFALQLGIAAAELARRRSEARPSAREAR